MEVRYHWWFPTYNNYRYFPDHFIYKYSTVQNFMLQNNLSSFLLYFYFSSCKVYQRLSPVSSPLIPFLQPPAQWEWKIARFFRLLGFKSDGRFSMSAKHFLSWEGTYLFRIQPHDSLLFHFVMSYKNFTSLSNDSLYCSFSQQDKYKILEPTPCNLSQISLVNSSSPLQ